MTRPYSIAFKQKMVDRLTGKDAVSAVQLARESGIRQQNLSRWLQEARSLPFVASDNRMDRGWTVEKKARVLAEAAKLTGDELLLLQRRDNYLDTHRRTKVSPMSSTAHTTLCHSHSEHEFGIEVRPKYTQKG